MRPSRLSAVQAPVVVTPVAVSNDALAGLGHIGCPIGHQPTTPLDQVRAPVGRLDLVADLVCQCRLHHLASISISPRRRAERAVAHGPHRDQIR